MAMVSVADVLSVPTHVSFPLSSPESVQALCQKFFVGQQSFLWLCMSHGLNVPEQLPVTC